MNMIFCESFDHINTKDARKGNVCERVDGDEI